MLAKIYYELLNKYGKQNWWPLTGYFKPFDEICIGAVLTQNTNWKNVEKALNNLIKKEITSLEKIQKISENELAGIIKPAGFYNQKSKTLKRVANFVINKGMYSLDREKLISIKGIGKETADTILLYGLNKPTFVVDAYTKRFFYRLGITENEKIDYDKLKNFIEKNIPEDIEIYKEYHALIVKHCKDYCKKNPECDNCFIKYKCYNYCYESR